MKTVLLGTSSLAATRLAYGCWRIGGKTAGSAAGSKQKQGARSVLAAYEAGYRLFDHADVYGDGVAEEIFGAVLRDVPAMRDNILIATKCGIRKKGDPGPDAPYRYDFRREHIVKSCERSLKRLQVETIDIYQLHRPDYLADPQEVAAAFTTLRQAGKVREFGLSNCRPTLFTTLQRFCPMRLIVQQIEISLLQHDCFTDGTIDHCLAETVTPLAWSPLAGGKLGQPRKSHSTNRLTPCLSAIATHYDVSPPVVALAWLLKHPSNIIPIVGTTRPDRIKALAQAADFNLSHEEWYELLVAARGERLP